MMAEAAAAHPSHAYFTDGNIARRCLASSRDAYHRSLDRFLLCLLYAEKSDLEVCFRLLRSLSQETDRFLLCGLYADSICGLR